MKSEYITQFSKILSLFCDTQEPPREYISEWLSMRDPDLLEGWADQNIVAPIDSARDKVLQSVRDLVDDVSERAPGRLNGVISSDFMNLSNWGGHSPV